MGYHRVQNEGEGRKDTKRRGGIVSRTESNFSVAFPGLIPGKTCQHSKPALPPVLPARSVGLLAWRRDVPIAVFNNFKFHTLS